jgi:hypothetical protein
LGTLQIGLDNGDVTLASSNGLISGSSQVSYVGLSNIPAGIISSSAQITISDTTGYGDFSSSLNTRILTEKGRVDTILSAADADKDSFAEIVTLINSVDTTNDNAFASFYTASVGRFNNLESTSASVNISVSNLNIFSASVETKNSNLATTTGSLLSSQTNLNTYTSSLNNAIQLTGSTVSFLGNIVVYGTQSVINSQNVEISDNILYLAPTASIDNDLGIVGHYNDGTYRHAGIFMDASDGHSWKVFNGLETETTATIDTSGTGFTLAPFKAGVITGTSFNGIVNATNGVVSGSSQITLSSTTGYGSVLNQAVLTTSTPTFGNLTINGTITATGDITAYYTSDKRHKNNIQLIPNALEKVSKLNGVTWEWNDDVNEVTKSTPKTGLIAQEVQSVLPEVVMERENGFLGLDYSKMMGLMVEAIKEQQTQIHSLTLEIEKLKESKGL